MCDYPSFYDEKRRKARKEHRCIECKLPIPKGFEYYAASGKWDGEVETMKLHEECREALNIKNRGVDCDDAIPFGCLFIDGLDPKETEDLLAKLRGKYVPEVAAS
jgi:hypothetical protein